MGSTPGGDGGGGGGGGGTLPPHSAPPQVRLGGLGGLGPPSSHACRMPGPGHPARRLLASQDDREILRGSRPRRGRDSSTVTRLGRDRAQIRIRSVGCPRAPLPRSGRSLILTGTRDSIRLRTRVTIRPCSELRAPRPRHGPLRGVTSPRGILSWCSPGRRQHQGPLVQAGPHPSSLRWRQRGGGRIRTPAPPAGGRPSRSVSSVHAFCAWSAGRHLFAGQSCCERSLGQRCTVTASRSKGTSRFSGTTSVKSSRSSHHTNPAQ